MVPPAPGKARTRRGPLALTLALPIIGLGWWEDVHNNRPESGLHDDGLRPGALLPSDQMARRGCAGESPRSARVSRHGRLSSAQRPLVLWRR